MVYEYKAREHAFRVKMGEAVPRWMWSLLVRIRVRRVRGAILSIGDEGTLTSMRRNRGKGSKEWRSLKLRIRFRNSVKVKAGE